MFNKKNKAMTNVEEYRKLNDSYSKSCVFHIGIDAGFFSEFNYLVFSILYCLENNIKLKLYSKDANFGYQNGWNDYFLPFTDEVNDSYHSLLNRHPTGFSMREAMLSKNVGLLKWKLKNEGLIFGAEAFKYFVRKNKFDYYTHNILPNIRARKKEYNIDGFIQGDYIDAYNRIFDLLWRFNDSVSVTMEELILNLNLPNNYIACQIRGGDKFIEYDLLSVDTYLFKIKEISSLKDVFVLTDDYRIIKQLRSKAPDYNWYTLCEESEKGYFNSSFSKSNPVLKKRQMISLFTSVELLCRSSVFLGTITATPCNVVGIRKYPDVHWVDFEKNKFYDSIDYSIEYKNILIKKFFKENEFE